MKRAILTSALLAGLATSPVEARQQLPYAACALTNSINFVPSFLQVRAGIVDDSNNGLVGAVVSGVAHKRIVQGYMYWHNESRIRDFQRETAYMAPGNIFPTYVPSATITMKVSFKSEAYTTGRAKVAGGSMPRGTYSDSRGEIGNEKGFYFSSPRADLIRPGVDYTFYMELEYVPTVEDPYPPAQYHVLFIRGHAATTSWEARKEENIAFCSSTPNFIEMIPPGYGATGYGAGGCRMATHYYYDPASMDPKRWNRSTAGYDGPALKDKAPRRGAIDSIGWDVDGKYRLRDDGVPSVDICNGR